MRATTLLATSGPVGEGWGPEVVSLAGDTEGPHHGHRGPAPRATPARDAAYWDDRYRQAEHVWSGRPNPQLVVEAADLAPATALDAGCGEGADAVWLAQRGWQVTAVDLSSVALERSAAAGHRLGVGDRITWLQADLTTWTPESYDLVSAQFVHLPREQREALHRRLAAAVRPGGTLLVVGHHPSDLQTTARRPPGPELFYTAEDVAAALDAGAWDIVVADARPRPAEDPEGRAITVRDTVLRAVRRA